MFLEIRDFSRDICFIRKENSFLREGFGKSAKIRKKRRIVHDKCIPNAEQ